jgi:cell division septum initiation protein DivIVA
VATAAPIITIEDKGQDLAQKTVCLKVHLGLIGNSRKVSNSQVEVDADKQLIRVSKILLDSVELQAIKTLDGEVRRYLYDNCLPFESGIQLVPLPQIETVDQKLREYAQKRLELVNAFVGAYPRLCEQAAARLRTLYNPNDYPPVDIVRSHFAFSWRYISFGVPGQLKEISARIFEDEREKAGRMMAEASSEIQQVLRAALAQMVAHLRDRLADQTDGKPQRIRESTVQKLRNFLDIFDFRNVTDDQEFKEQVEKARQLLGGVSTDAIRNTAELRARIKDGMAEIAGRLDTMVADRVGRKFRLDEF